MKRPRIAKSLLKKSREGQILSTRDENLGNLQHFRKYRRTTKLFNGIKYRAQGQPYVYGTVVYERYGMSDQWKRRNYLESGIRKNGYPYGKR